MEAVDVTAVLGSPDRCRLLVSEPPSTVLDAEVVHLTAPGPHGRFVILPRHVDTVIPIGTGWTRCVAPAAVEPRGGQGEAETYLAHGQGILVKIGREIRIVFDHVIACDRLEDAERVVRARFEAATDRERRAGAILDRLQADIAHHLAARPR